jgi:YidC/Oxa1 family membrane protein insertase
MISLLTITFLFFQAWEKDNKKSSFNNQAEYQEIKNFEKEYENENIDHHSNTLESEDSDIKNIISSNSNTKNLELISIKTDLFNLKISPKGGDLVFLEMNNYLDDDKKNKYVLFNNNLNSNNNYYMQTGLISEFGPDSHKFGRFIYSSEKTEYDFTNHNSDTFIDLTYSDENISVVKRFILKKNSYEIEIQHIFSNHSSKTVDTNIYARIRKNYQNKNDGFLIGTNKYDGVIISNKTNSFEKISFDDIKKGRYKAEEDEGWISIVENYFISVLIPENNKVKYVFSTEMFKNGEIGIRFVSSERISVPKNSNYTYTTKLYAGPILPDILKDVAPKLELTADYGFLWPICTPIFHLLKYIYKHIGNWGFSIILVTLFIKIAFYWLNAKNYRSMGNLRKLEPRINKIKETYGDDKKKFGQALMELYKKEKVNPLGGCLPILIQLPVFVALYWVLLGSVELRHAPFILWINDLSSKDPYFILPIIMGITMFLQQSLSPKPADPIQAKVMRLIPFVFTLLFLNFPSGLVLYWVVSNILSILQQWFIMRNIKK